MFRFGFSGRVRQKNLVLSDYKKQQNVLEILLCSARIPQSEKLSFSHSVNMWKTDQVGKKCSKNLSPPALSLMI